MSGYEGETVPLKEPSMDYVELEKVKKQLAEQQVMLSYLMTAPTKPLVVHRPPTSDLTIYLIILGCLAIAIIAGIAFKSLMVFGTLAVVLVGLSAFVIER